MSKTDKVLYQLQNNGSITSWEAITKYRATRLSGIIFNLRKQYKIDGVWETYTNQDGETSRYIRYIYKGEIA